MILVFFSVCVMKGDWHMGEGVTRHWGRGDGSGLPYVGKYIIFVVNCWIS